MLTKNDLQNIENIFDRKLDEKLDEKLKPVNKRLKSIETILSHENAMIIRRVKHLEDKTGFRLPA